MMKMMSKVDVEIAEKLFGFRKDSDGYWRAPNGNDAIKGDERLWSTDAELALEVLDELRRRGYRVLVNLDTEGIHLRHVACIVHDGVRNEMVYHCDKPLGTAKKPGDLPELICKAALELIK